MEYSPVVVPLGDNGILPGADAVVKERSEKNMIICKSLAIDINCKYKKYEAGCYTRPYMSI
jgi:hypothetical protein